MLSSSDVVQWLTPYALRLLFPTLKRQIRRYGLAIAVHHALKQNGIAVKVKGMELSQLDSGRVLLISNHMTGWERFLLLDMAGKAGRNDIYSIALPVSPTVRYLSTVDIKGKGNILPVAHNGFAGSRRARLFGFSMTPDEVKRMNRQSLEAATHRLIAGNMISIFPAQVGSDAVSDVWFTGIGRIVATLPLHIRRQTLVVPCDCRDALASVFMKALFTGKVPFWNGRYPITVNTAGLTTLYSVIGASYDHRDSTELLRQHYCRSLS